MLIVLRQRYPANERNVTRVTIPVHRRVLSDLRNKTSSDFDVILARSEGSGAHQFAL
jgi:hypothetical protein